MLKVPRAENNDGDKDDRIYGGDNSLFGSEGHSSSFSMAQMAAKRWEMFLSPERKSSKPQVKAQ